MQKQYLFFRMLPPVVCLFLNLLISMKKSKLGFFFFHWSSQCQLVTSRMLIGDWHKTVVAALKERPASWRNETKTVVLELNFYFNINFKTSFIFSKFRPQSPKLYFNFSSTWPISFVIFWDFWNISSRMTRTGSDLTQHVVGAQLVSVEWEAEALCRVQSWGDSLPSRACQASLVR